MQGDERQARARRSLDEAIDDAVREMTRTEMRDDAVARVMACVQDAAVERSAVGHGARPRVMWAGAAAVAAALLVSVAIGYWWQTRTPLARTPHATPAAATNPTGQAVESSVAQRVPPAQRPDLIARAPSEGVTVGGVHGGAARTPSTQTTPPTRRTQATPGTLGTPGTSATQRRARAEPATSVAATHTTSVDDEWQSDLLPPESAIVVASITPELLTPPTALGVEPLRTSPLIVDAIPISPIDMPPVAPGR